jgi:hypothetical protein
MNDNEYRLEKPKSHLKGQKKIWIKINWIRSHLEARFYTSVIKIKYNLFRKSLVIFLFVTFLLNSKIDVFSSQKAVFLDTLIFCLRQFGNFIKMIQLSYHRIISIPVSK